MAVCLVQRLPRMILSVVRKLANLSVDIKVAIISHDRKLAIILLDGNIASRFLSVDGRLAEWKQNRQHPCVMLLVQCQLVGKTLSNATLEATQSQIVS